MVVLNKIYTRTGDKGDTALGDMSRVAKHSLRVTSYGTVDELNSVLGLARLNTSGDMDDMLSRIQNDLFDLGADLCCPNPDKDGEAEYPPLRIAASQIDRLEEDIDKLNADLEPLRSFILPGGSVLSAHLHHCRTVCRRAERCVTELADVEAITAESLKYLNRLSDLFFVAARVVNNNGKDDILWVPGANRK